MDVLHAVVEAVVLIVVLVLAVVRAVPSAKQMLLQHPAGTGVRVCCISVATMQETSDLQLGLLDSRFSELILQCL